MGKYDEKEGIYDSDFNQVDILSDETFNKSKEQIMVELQNAPIEIYKMSNKLATMQQQVINVENKKKILKLNMKKIIGMEKDEKGKAIYSSDVKLTDEVNRRLDLSKEYSQLFDEASYVKMEIQSYQTKIAYLERIFELYNNMLEQGLLK